MLKEPSEQADRIGDIISTASLTDTVHAQLRVTQIQSTSTQGSRQHRADGATAAGIIANNEQLQGNGLAGLGRRLACDLLEQDNTRRVGGVASVRVNLNNGALVHLGLVVLLVLGSIIRVDGVSHVGGDQERGGEGLFIGSGQVDIRGQGEGRTDRRRMMAGRALESAPWAVRLPISS